MTKKLKPIIYSMLITLPILLQANIRIQQFNHTAEFPVVTAAPGYYWKLGGTIHDLTQFAGTGNGSKENPFGWGNWQNYGEVTVVDGILKATATGTTPRLISMPAAFQHDLAKFRFLEIKFRKESELGTGMLWLSIDGAAGQPFPFPIANGSPANVGTEVNSIILDLHQIPGWNEGELTHIGLELHTGQAGSVIGSTDYIYSIRLGSELFLIP